VPEHEYLWNADDNRDRIDRDLGVAQLCVHLVAQTESIEPDVPVHGKLQLELAHAAMKRLGRPSPLVWIQPAAAVHPSAQALVDYIENDLANEGVEYWRGGLEELKTQIYDKLAPAPAPAQTVGTAAQLRKVALLVEEGDLGGIGPLRAFLADSLAIDAHPVRFAGSEPKDAGRLAHALAGTDRCLLVWGSQPEDWVQDVLDHPALAAHLGTERLCVYAMAPSTVEKSTFRSARARTIVATDALGEAGLRAFLGAAKSAA
jgi:hypothetical protein